MNEIELILFQFLHFIIYGIILFTGGLATIVAMLVLYIIGATWWLPFYAGDDVIGRKIAFEHYSLPFFFKNGEITPLNFTMEIAFVNSLMIGIIFLVPFVLLLGFLCVLHMTENYCNTKIYTFSHLKSMRNPIKYDETTSILLSHTAKKKSQTEKEKSQNKAFKYSSSIVFSFYG